MIKLNKLLIGSATLTIFLAPCAHAAFADAISCGDGREGGPEKAAFAIVDPLDGVTEFYLNGKLVDDSKVGIKSRDGGLWYVTVDEGDRPARKFVINQVKATAQESSVVLATEKETLVGSVQHCIVDQGDN